MKIDPVQSVPSEFLHDIESIMFPRANKVGFAFSMRCAPSLPNTMMVDAFRAKHVLMHLCSNAIKFTPKGAVMRKVAIRVISG